MAWNNQQLVLYHGTTTVDLKLAYLHVQSFTYGTLTNFSVDLNQCRANTDFGKGFYTTTSLHQAREWANTRFTMHGSPSASSQAAVVLSFEVDRDWLGKLEQLHFSLDSHDFYEFVDHCRDPTKRPHGRTGAPPYYEIVWGPVRMGAQRLVIQDCDQLSFHTRTVCDKLKARVAELATLSGTARPGYLP